jgi:hypothetical protein
MSLVRPVRKLTDPSGNKWEIYVSGATREGSAFRQLVASLLRRPSRALRVEAVTFLPRRQTYLWTTTTDHIARVLDQIAAGLEAGELARPLGAVYRGAT